MASVSTHKSSGLRRLIFQLSTNGKRCQIYLGRIPLKQAQSVQRRVESLIAAKRSGSTIDGETASWLSTIDSKLRNALVKVGLAEPGVAQVDLTLQELVDRFYSSQAVKPATLAAYKQATDSLLGFLGSSTLVRRIDCRGLESWHKSLHDSGLAPATVTKRINVAKSVFGKGVKWGVIKACPLRNIKRGSQVNPARLHYVPSDVIDTVLAKCPDGGVRLAVLLARYAGLRCPSELCDLRWQDCNLDCERPFLRIRCSKLSNYGQKGVRDVPITPPVRAALLEIGPGSPDDRVVPRVTSKSTNLRTALEAAIEHAGVSAWPRLFQNLRASCEMDWADAAGHHAAAAWIGHSLEVSAKHYVRVRDVHFEKVTGRLIGDVTNDAGATQSATQDSPAPKSNNPQQVLQSPVRGRVVRRGAVRRRRVRKTVMGDTGFEPVTPRV